MLFLAFSVQAQTDAILRPIGGSGGGQFVARCPSAEVLTGFELRTGDDVDAIAPICIPALPGQFHTYPRMFGGDGGGPRQLVCPNDAPVVNGMFIGAEGVTIVVNNIHLFCGPVSDAQPQSNYPAAVFDAPKIPVQWVNGIIDKAHVGRLEETQRCPPGLIGVGITGRSGIWLDAVGLICAPLQVAINATPPPPPPPPPPKPVVVKPQVSDRISATARTHSASSVLGRRSSTIATPAMAAQTAAGTVRSSVQGRDTRPIATPAPAGPAPAAPLQPPRVLAPAVFTPPLLEDGGQLWACANDAEAQADGGACPGLASAQAYCGLRNAQADPDVQVADAQPGTVRAVAGDACMAEACRVVSRVQCDH